MALDDFRERDVLEFQLADEAAVRAAELQIDRCEDRLARDFGEGAARNHRRFERELRREADLDFGDARGGRRSCSRSPPRRLRGAARCGPRAPSA